MKQVKRPVFIKYDMSSPIELIVPRMDFRQAVAEGVDIDYPDGQQYARYYTSRINKKYRSHLNKWEMMTLELPFKDKDDAKELSRKEGDAGLRWIPKYRHWCIPRQASTLFQQWDPQPLTPTSEMPTEDDDSSEGDD